MPHFIAEAIRAHIGPPQSDSDHALLVVVDQCEQLHSDNRDNARQFALEFELVIVRTLNVAFPIEQVEQVQRLLGH